MAQWRGGDTGIPYGRQFDFWLLYVLCSSLLTHWEAEDGPSAWALPPMREASKKFLPLAWPSLSPCGQLGSKPAQGKALSPALCSSDFQMGK